MLDTKFANKRYLSVGTSIENEIHMVIRETFEIFNETSSRIIWVARVHVMTLHV
jgi:hypothetical protein